jgi:Streptomycin adenylyltransferase.
MRTENEVFRQVLEFAKGEDKVRAVLLNGSRVNPNVKKDLFCDYDLVFSVTDPEYYLHNQVWIERFGELVIMQQNDFSVSGKNAYIFLMQFQDGVRIDLSFHPIVCIAESVRLDSLTKVLLDKDQRIGLLTPPNESYHYVKRPAEKEFDKLMNEAWWIQTYVAKGIWRDELPLIKYMFDGILMDCIVKLLSWHVGLGHDWQINAGKCGKWLKSYLPGDIYHEFISIYPGNNYEEIWEKLFAAGKLIRKIGTKVAQGLSYTYPMQDDIHVTDYLQKVRLLPNDADNFV